MIGKNILHYKILEKLPLSSLRDCSGLGGEVCTGQNKTKALSKKNKVDSFVPLFPFSFFLGEEMIGKTILHYKILEKLGEGGMGMVYLAKEKHLTFKSKYFSEDRNNKEVELE